MRKWVLASANAGKAREFRALLAPFDIECMLQSECGVEPVEETGSTFIENAILKARHAADKMGLPAIADDSGLMVEVLGNQPGIFSARYGGITRLLNDMQGEKNRAAQFVCVIAVMLSAKDPLPSLYQGIWRGEILETPKGDAGFGYDPVFYVPTHDCSAAELDMQTKNHISHRGIAFQQFLSDLKGQVFG